LSAQADELFCRYGPDAAEPPGWIIRKKEPLAWGPEQEGDLKVGDRAPDALLVSLDGKSRQSLLEAKPAKPAVLIFGSFT
jgi:hypothetical protein